MKSGEDVKSSKGISNDRPVVIVRKKTGTRHSPTGPTPAPPRAAAPTPKTAVPEPSPQPLPEPQQPQPLQTTAPSATANPGPSKKAQERQARRDLLEVLRDRWPRAFPREHRQVRPLALGIRQDIAAHFPAQPPGRIGFVISLYQYLMRPAYYRAVLQGGPRYDLDGTPRGEVTLKEREQAGRDLHAYYEEQRTKTPAPRAAAPSASPPEEGEGTRPVQPVAKES